MDKTKVQVQCVSKKESKNWNPENPIETQIELSVPYDQKSIYWAMSGGTGFLLNTCNQEAADMFVIGKDYMVEIAPVEEKEV